jgi:outer membrane protein assembly factor BamB
MGHGDVTEVAGFVESPADWPTFRANNQGSATSDVEISKEYRRLWWFTPRKEYTPTAPVASGGLVFFSGSDGIVRAVDAQTGETQWKVYTGGAVRLPPTLWKGRVFVGSGDGWVYALEAKTGRLLWRFMAAPVDRKIPVYGSLQSTWPVASGVLVEDGTAYLAAGINNFDGTHVYALDAVTGKIKWQNNTSGHLDPEARTGASVQGHMLIHDGKLYLASGSSFSPAVYDITNGKCLNDPAPLKECRSIHPRGWELFLVGTRVLVGGQPFYGHPDNVVYSLDVTRKVFHASNGRKDIVWIDNNKIMCFDPIDTGLLDKLYVESNEKSWMENIWLRNFEIPDEPIWEVDVEGSSAIAICKNAVVLASIPESGVSSVGAGYIDDGKFLWGYELPASPVPWGLAVDSEGRVIVTLKDGQVMCYGPGE